MDIRKTFIILGALNQKKATIMTTLERGTRFVQAFKTTNPITFEVVEIDREKNSMRVLCTDSNGYSHEETWDGMDGVKQTEIQIRMGEYKVI